MKSQQAAMKSEHARMKSSANASDEFKSAPLPAEGGFHREAISSTLVDLFRFGGFSCRCDLKSHRQIAIYSFLIHIICNNRAKIRNKKFPDRKNRSGKSIFKQIRKDR